MEMDWSRELCMDSCGMDNRCAEAEVYHFTNHCTNSINFRYLSTIEKIMSVLCFSKFTSYCSTRLNVNDLYNVSNSSVFVSSLKTWVISHKKDSTTCLLGCFLFVSIHSETIESCIHHDHSQSVGLVIKTPRPLSLHCLQLQYSQYLLKVLKPLRCCQL